MRQTLKSDSEDLSDRRALEAKAQKALDEHKEELDAVSTSSMESQRVARDVRRFQSQVPLDGVERRGH